MSMTTVVDLPPITFAQLVTLSTLVGQIEAGAPFVFLLPGQRKALSGSLFPDADAVVDATARALIDHPDLLSGAGQDGHSLLQDHLAAVALKSFIYRTTTLLEAARDTWTALSARNVQRAMAVLNFVRHEEDIARQRLQLRQPPPQEGLTLWRRRMVLLGAWTVVDAYYGSLKARKAAKKQARLATRPQHQATADSNPAAQPDPSKPSHSKPNRTDPGPATSRSRQDSKDGIRLQTLEAFEAKVRDSRSPEAIPPTTQTTTPLAFSAAGMRRLDVQQGDRSAVKPRKRPRPPSPHKQMHKQMTDLALQRYLATTGQAGGPSKTTSMPTGSQTNRQTGRRVK